MLYLVFDIDDEGYALAADEIVEMLPYVPPRPVRGAPAEIIGSIGYRGQFLPVFDLTALERGHPAQLRMGTRIAVVPVPAGDGTALVGLILENATEMLRCDPTAFRPFADGPRGLVQRLQLDGLLPRHLADHLALAPEQAA